MGGWTDLGEPAYVWLVRVHLAIGFAGLVLFWIGVIARKGGPLHLFSGKLFVSCVYAVAASAQAVLSAGSCFVLPTSSKMSDS